MENFYFYISFALLVTSYLFISHIYHKINNLPPTIFPTIPVIGHLYLLKAPLHRTLAKISTKYGSVVLLHFGSRRVLLVSSPSNVEECFTKNDIIFANRPDMLFGKIYGNNYTSLIWANYTDNWRNLRRITSIEILSIHRVNEFHDIRSDEGRHLIRKLMSYSSPINMKLIFYEFTLNVIMRMISGKRYFGGDITKIEEEGKSFRKMVDEAFLLAGTSNLDDYLPTLTWFGMKELEKKLIALREKRDVFFQELIGQLRKPKGEVETKKKTMIEVLLSLQESDPEYYTDEMIQCFVMVLIMAGSETSSGTLEWALSLLLNNPQVLEKAQKEIDIHVGNHHLINESNIEELPYIRCIINETLRLYPPAPLLIPHQSSDDCKVAGYHIPRGTMLLVNLWAMHHDPNSWNDPESFKPERFEGLQGTRDWFKLMPFGYGRRSCPGEGLALRVLGLTLGLLIQCFDWERVTKDMVDMTEGPGITMPKAKPLVAKCRPRVVMKSILSQL